MENNTIKNNRVYGIRAIRVKNGNLNQHLEAAINKKSIEELNSAFEVISKCLNLLEGKNNEGKSLGAALILSIQKVSRRIHLREKL